MNSDELFFVGTVKFLEWCHMTSAVPRLMSSLQVAGAYVMGIAPVFAVWEVAQLPLYTIWAERGAAESLVAAMHCTLGDMVLAGATFLSAVRLAHVTHALRSSSALIATAVAFGIIATITIEFVSAQWLSRWSYAESMPRLAGFGLAPILQWILVPTLGLLAQARAVDALFDDRT